MDAVIPACWGSTYYFYLQYSNDAVLETKVVVLVLRRLEDKKK